MKNRCFDMSNKKINNSWLVPSFDCDTTNNKSLRKGNYSQRSNDHIEIHNISSKRKNICNISTLLSNCEPKTQAELVISRQKKQEILNWLENKAHRGKPTVLVISGPSGCGKTISIKLLAKEYGFEVTEWINSIDQLMDENNRIMTQSNKFVDFMVRATRYNSVLTNCSKRLLLVKDFPNIYYENKESFHSMLERYFELGRDPIVFICTDTEGNSKLLHTLFVPHIREKFDINFISINPVTQVSMKNMLKRVSPILNSEAANMLHITQEHIDEILSNSIGDARNALLNIVFISLKVPKELVKNECTNRSESLGLLHGIGRVINPKRIQEENSWKFVHNPDEIAEYFQSQTTTFLYFLHENYLNTIRLIEESDISANVLSLGDVLNSEWRDLNLSKLSLSLCIRGIMVANESPVSGWNPIRKPQFDKNLAGNSLNNVENQWYKSLIDKDKDKNTTITSDVEMDEISD
ncbi:cell cycle checkpoint protein RAD17 isoform X1 [Polistes fuscatus]|uniref:cell cycle checkpoint protein RAD17 isoform X1 n=2 Tax=Polistes fuscatus TaxID=30207 RepID=UPI001CA88012|nr:cell cycle checkpoint protein RAD17 isoform X1 [Polistes fuscatus]